MADPLKKAIVSAGRTVTVGVKNHGPGEEVTLPSEEIKRLTALGFLVDPNAKEVPKGNGPTFDAKDGPSVQQIA